MSSHECRCVDLKDALVPVVLWVVGVVAVFESGVLDEAAVSLVEPQL